MGLLLSHPVKGYIDSQRKLAELLILTSRAKGSSAPFLEINDSTMFAIASVWTGALHYVSVVFMQTNLHM